MRGEETRQTIVQKADEIFYRQGFEATSFADIADAVGISRGNFYHHFRTKDAILDAVIDMRREHTRSMLVEWEDSTTDPAERVNCFVRILITNQARIMLHGCPVGTLCTELAKLQHPALHRAKHIFALFGDWLERQFRALGHDEPEARDRALRVLAFSQGVATLAAAFRDETYVRREVDRMCDLIRQQAPL